MQENDKGKAIEELIPEEKRKFNFDFADNKFAFYFGLFYTFGLFLGSYFYKIAQNDTLNKIVMIKDENFLNMFLSTFCVYFVLFLLVSFLGFCLISYPVINIFPVIIGIATGMKLAYYYINYSAKGVGYSLIMIVPYTALFVTVITYTMKVSTELSKRIRSLTKGEGEQNFEMLPYLKKYLILSVVVAAAAAVNAGLTKLLFAVVTI
ncbi:MAG: stage II sporulation protein M [Eubacterium sp.]